MSTYIHKRHNVSVLLYHAVCPAKYRRVVFDEAVEAVLKETCLDIAARYEVTFIEIGTDAAHVHFLMQSVPTLSPTRLVQMVKSLTAREVFRRVPSVKSKLWGGALWHHSSGRAASSSTRSVATGARRPSVSPSRSRGGSRSTRPCTRNSSICSDVSRQPCLCETCDTSQLAAAVIH